MLLAVLGVAICTASHLGNPKRGKTSLVRSLLLFVNCFSETLDSVNVVSQSNIFADEIPCRFH